MNRTEPNTVPEIAFVSWNGHWFGVPGRWVDNLKRAGLVVIDSPPPSAQQDERATTD
jgi:hypothetical protein